MVPASQPLWEGGIPAPSSKTGGGQGRLPFSSRPHGRPALAAPLGFFAKCSHDLRTGHLTSIHAGSQLQELPPCLSAASPPALCHPYSPVPPQSVRQAQSSFPSSLFLLPCTLPWPFPTWSLFSSCVTEMCTFPNVSFQSWPCLWPLDTYFIDQKSADLMSIFLKLVFPPYPQKRKILEYIY